MWERPLRLVFLRPYRCRDCGHRQYAFTFRQRATIQSQSRSLPDTQFPSGVSQAAAGSVRLGNSRKWILIYAVLTCMAIGAIASLRLGNGLLRRDYLNALRLSLARLVHKVHDESPQPETGALKSPQAEAPRTTADEAAKAPASVQLMEPRSSVSRDEDASGLSSAEAMRAPRPKLPASIKSKITSDNTIRVRVRIDKSGRVAAATVLSADGAAATSLVRYALATARRWRFRPARQNGTPIRSEIVLEFQFRPTEIVVSRVEASSQLPSQ